MMSEYGSDDAVRAVEGLGRDHTQKTEGLYPHTSPH